MPAPEYVEHLMGWVQSNIDNEQMFPSRIGMLRRVEIWYKNLITALKAFRFQGHFPHLSGSCSNVYTEYMHTSTVTTIPLWSSLVSSHI